MARLVNVSLTILSMILKLMIKKKNHKIDATENMIVIGTEKRTGKETEIAVGNRLALIEIQDIADEVIVGIEVIEIDIIVDEVPVPETAGIEIEIVGSGKMIPGVGTAIEIEIVVVNDLVETETETEIGSEFEAQVLNEQLEKKKLPPQRKKNQKKRKYLESV